MKIGLLNIAIGCVAILIGLAVTIGSYAAVSGSGGHYVVAWGAVVVGGWRVILGLVQLLRTLATPEGRQSLAHFVWPHERVGRYVRLALVAVVALIMWVVAPESWTTFTPSSLRTYQGRDEIKSLAYAPTGNWIALGMGYGGIALVNAKTGEAGMAPSLDSYADVEAVAFSPDGQLLAAVTYQGLRIWASSDWGHSAPTLIMSNPQGDYGVVFSPDGTLLATGSVSSGVLIWDIKSRSLKWQSPTKDSVNGVAFSADSQVVASGHDGEVKLWSASSGQLRQTLNADGIYQPFTTLAFFKDGRVAAGSYQMPGITIWDSKSGATLLTLHTGTSHLWSWGNAWSIAIAPDDSWIAAGVSDGSIRFWSSTSVYPKRTMFGAGKDILSIAVSPDGLQTASGGADNVMKIWANSR